MRASEERKLSGTQRNLIFLSVMNEELILSGTMYNDLNHHIGGSGGANRLTRGCRTE